MSSLVPHNTSQTIKENGESQKCSEEGSTLVQERKLVHTTSPSDTTLTLNFTFSVTL